MPTRFLLWLSLAVLAVATLASAAGAVTSVPHDPGAMPDCHYGAGHNLCFDGSSCYASGTLMLRLTSDAYSQLKENPAADDTGIPELDGVNVALGATSFSPQVKPRPNEDTSSEIFRWVVVRFPGSVPEARSAYADIPEIVDLSEVNGAVYVPENPPAYVLFQEGRLPFLPDDPCAPMSFDLGFALPPRDPMPRKAISPPGPPSIAPGPPSAAAAALKCSRQAARKAVSSSSFANAVQRESDRLQLQGSLFDVWRVDDLHCRDVTRDGRADIVVLLGVRGASSGAPPVPWAIFRATDSGYVLAFQRSRFVGHRVRVTAGGDVIYTVPIYKRSDPLCCPSSYKSYRVHWRNVHSVVRRVHKGAPRRS